MSWFKVPCLIFLCIYSMRRWKTTELLSKKGLKMWYCSVESNSCCTSRAVESEAGLWGYSHLRAFFSQEHETAIFHASMNTLANSHTNVVDFVCVIFRQKNWRSSVSRFSKIPASVNTYNMFVSSQTEPPPPAHTGAGMPARPRR